MKRILVISWFYPPINSSEAMLTAKLLKYSRYTYDIFTQGRSEAWSFGRSDLPGCDKQRRIEAQSSEPGPWTDEAVRYFSAHREEYDIIMTRSMPPECHLAGLRIKKRFPEVRWIASFGDPIGRNPYEIIGGGLWSPYSMNNPLNQNRRLLFRLSPMRLTRDLLWTLRHFRVVQRRRKQSTLEANTMRLADRLIFNNTSQLRYMADCSAFRSKAVIIRHSYDPALYPKLGPEKAHRRLRFVFLGQLNAIRTAQPLLQAIHALKESLGDLPERAEFLFFGELPDADLAAILRLEIGDAVHVHKPVSYEQSLAVMAAADWLVHIDGNISAVTDENIFFAGKLADYFGAGKPILAMTMARGDAADCLRRAGAMVLSYSVNEIRQALFQIIYRGLQPHMDEDYLRGFSAQQTAAILDEKVVKTLL